MKRLRLQTPFGRVALVAMALSCSAWLGSARVLDNFNDNTKTGWTDFTFVPGFGLPAEAGGQFGFNLPPAGQDIFTASQKVSENFELKEGRTIEFRVDLVEGSGADAFAVLAFIPNTGGNSPGTLAGYGLAKDVDDVLITKGIQKYFVADDTVTAELKHNNVTLVLTLTAKGGNVTVTGKILDKDDANKVIWERTVVDTPAADALDDGTDSPAAPYITSGYFTLYCYQQFNTAVSSYSVTYDNAEVYVLDESVLDDFNDNTKTGWTDFTFVPGFGLPQEAGGQFQFDLPPAGQDIFTASQKTTRQFELKEGERHEFRVDVVEGSGEDAYAVLAFIPNTGGNSPGTLAGYGLAKDPTDVLITKGVQKYFVADDSTAAELKQNNITLSLSLTVKEGSVVINGRILDKDDGNKVIWERSVVDTPGADVFDDGTDSPAAPYITSGYFTLYCYQQFNAGIGSYTVHYDNAVVVAPPAAANTAPIISEIQPAEFSAFLPASTSISFKVADDKDLSNDKISVVLNGQTFTVANGLTVSGTGGTKTASLSGLAANVNYAAELRAEDSEGVSTVRNLYFDTLAASNFVIEVEDYNFDAGSYFNNPVRTAEGGGQSENSYTDRIGVEGTDFHDTRTAPNGGDTKYRTADPVRMQQTRDQARPQFDPPNLVYDYDVGDLAEGEWLQYTRVFAPGSYEVYLRQSLANIAAAESVLELVTGDRTQPNAASQPLGSFLGKLSGFQYRTFALTDGAGANRIVLRLNGLTTLRLRQITPDPADGARMQNYLIFVPVADPGKQRATVSAVSPANGVTTAEVAPVVSAVIQNRDTTVKIPTIVLTVNGAPVNATVAGTATGATVSYPLTPLPPTGSQVACHLSFKDSDDVEIAIDWSFTLAYLTLDPANRAAAGTNRGMKVRVVQAPQGSGLENSLSRAEDQLAPNSKYEKVVDTTVTEQVINQSQEGLPAGYFNADNGYPDNLVPGVTGDNGTDDFVVEAQMWLELPAGAYRFGLNSDDGHKLSAGASPADKTPVLIAHSGGPSDEPVDVVVTESGLYPMRFLWYERGGGAHGEFFSVNLNTGERTLINDPAKPTAIKAYLDAVKPQVKLQAAATVNGPYVDEPGASINEQTKTITTTASGAARFYRLVGGSALKVKTVAVQGTQVTMTYE